MYQNKATRLVLGEGETIGHKHVLVSDTELNYQRDERAMRFLLLKSGLFTHDEHDRMLFRPRRHSSYHQQEFNPMDGTVGNIFD